MHQGAQAVLDKLTKDQYMFYKKDGDLYDLETMVKEYTQSCADCSRIEAIKSKIALGHADQTGDGLNSAEEGEQGTNLQRGGFCVSEAPRPVYYTFSEL